MQKITDLSCADWILQNIEEQRASDKERGIRASTLLPPGFDHYWKVLFPFSDVTAGRSTEHPDGMPLKWRDLANRLGVQLSAVTFEKTLSTLALEKIPGLELYRPTEGYIEPYICRALTRALNDATADNRAYIYSVRLGVAPDTAYLVALNELCESYEQLTEGSFRNYWWPPDRSWCLCHDGDLSFAIVGGNMGTMRKFRAQSELEIMEIDLTTRIDHYSDWDT